jgi:hypothetical protein
MRVRNSRRRGAMALDEISAGRPAGTVIIRKWKKTDLK